MGWFSWCYKFRSQAARAMGMDLQHQQVRYARTLAEYVGADSAWLDLGAGTSSIRVGRGPARSLRKSWPDGRGCCAGWMATSIDSPDPLIHNRVLGDVGRLPFLDSSFTVISANMVMEHVADPAAALREMERVLAPGGVFIFHRPTAASIRSRSHPFCRRGSRTRSSAIR